MKIVVWFVDAHKFFHDLDLPPFQNNVGVVPDVIKSQSSRWIKIKMDKNS